MEQFLYLQCKVQLRLFIQEDGAGISEMVILAQVSFTQASLGNTASILYCGREPLTSDHCPAGL